MVFFGRAIFESPFKLSQSFKIFCKSPPQVVEHDLFLLMSLLPHPVPDGVYPRVDVGGVLDGEEVCADRAVVEAAAVAGDLEKKKTTYFAGF